MLYSLLIIQLWERKGNYRMPANCKLREIDSTSEVHSPCIAVPFFGNLNLDSPDLNSDIFFWHQTQSHR